LGGSEADAPAAAAPSGAGGAGTPPEAPRPASPATRIAALLREPGGMKQAIVLGEILNRPEARWR
jgi:hypothetical protein